MRIHTANRRKIQDATKGAKLRGQFIGGRGKKGGGNSLTSPKRCRPRLYDYPLFPTRMDSSSTVFGIHHRAAKKGIFSRAARDVLDLVVGGKPAYVRGVDGSIRKVGA